MFHPGIFIVTFKPTSTLTPFPQLLLVLVFLSSICIIMSAARKIAICLILVFQRFHSATVNCNGDCSCPLGTIEGRDQSCTLKYNTSFPLSANFQSITIYSPPRFLFFCVSYQVAIAQMCVRNTCLLVEQAIPALFGVMPNLHVRREPLWMDHKPLI